MLKVEDIFVVFFSGTPLERIALRGINFNAEKGEVISILGNNGSGRSTLLKFLAGHICSNFGRIWYNNVDITGQTLFERSKIFSIISYDQHVGTAGNLTVAENMAIASQHHQSRSMFYPAIDSEMKEIFYEQLKEINFMGLETLIDEKVYKLSKPQRHILAIVMALIKETDILLIDEFSTGLDKETADHLLDTAMKIIKSKKLTTILAINDARFAIESSNKVLVLNHGQIMAELDSNSKDDCKVQKLLSSFDVVNALGKD